MELMHQSISAAPSPHPGYCGAFTCLFSPGGGAFANFALPSGLAFANPGAIPELFQVTHTHGFQSEYNYTEDITEKKADYKLGTAGIDWCITFWKRKKLSITFSHQNNWKIVDNSFKTKQIWDWKKKTRTKVCLVSTMTYNLSLPVLRSSVMTKRSSTTLKPTPHLITPDKFKKGIFMIKILLVNFNDVYGIISYWLNETTLWAWWVGTGDGAEL